MIAYRMGDTAYFTGHSKKKTFTIIRSTFNLFAYCAANGLKLPDRRWRSPMNDEYTTMEEAEAALKQEAGRRNWEAVNLTEVYKAYKTGDQE